MQALAREMNLSETAFPVRDKGFWQLRWFTPKAEVDLCGHATLASAHILWETGTVARGEPIVFDTRSGKLSCVASNGWIDMDFPSEPPVAADDPGDLIAALNAPGAVRGKKRNRMDYLVEVADAQTLRNLQPDLRALAKLPVRGIIVTARSDEPQFDFLSRFFAPAVGVDEDPVTGSAHCCLAPYWAEKLVKNEMLAFQASPRGGVVRVALRGNRVILGGQAVTVLRARLLAEI